MEMLLRDVTIPELAGIYRRHRRRSPAPYLIDPKVISRARRLAKKNGIWADLAENLDTRRDIPILRGSDFRRLRRTKDRRLTHMDGRGRELSRAALALWLGHPNADVDYLQDLLWAYCEDSTWVHGVHDGNVIDLSSSAMAATLAELVYVLGGHLEEAVKDRVAGEIERRVFDPFCDYRNLDGWRTVRNNWNHVCNGQVVRAALYQIQDPAQLASLTHVAIQHLTYGLDGFGEDGGCGEGPGYYNYGFGHYLYVAESLHQRTGGRVNLMTDDKVTRICRYPLAANIAGPLYSCFADASHGYLPARIALLINRFHAMPEVFGLCDRHPDGTLKLSGMHDLALYDGEKAGTQADDRDYVLPDLGQVKLRGRAGRKQMTVMAIAGNNGVSHNHNDVGSFIVHRQGRLHLVDPGGPIYTERTFSSRRYDSVYCSSVGHSVPVINGRHQEVGAGHYGVLEVEGLNEAGVKRATVDMTQAYPEGTVERLVRSLSLDPDRNALTLVDAYTFGRKPRALEETFITFGQVRKERGGKSVRIGTKTNGLTITAEGVPGRFAVTRMTEEAWEGRTDDVIARITFTPTGLAREMTLSFRIE